MQEKEKKITQTSQKTPEQPEKLAKKHARKRKKPQLKTPEKSVSPKETKWLRLRSKGTFVLTP